MLIMTLNSAKNAPRADSGGNQPQPQGLNPTPALVRYFYTSISQNFITEDLCTPHYSRLSYGYGVPAAQCNDNGARFTLGLAWVISRMRILDQDSDMSPLSKKYSEYSPPMRK
jgi:hypothetical protein